MTVEGVCHNIVPDDVKGVGRQVSLSLSLTLKSSPFWVSGPLSFRKEVGSALLHLQPSTFGLR